MSLYTYISHDNGHSGWRPPGQTSFSHSEVTDRGVLGFWGQCESYFSSFFLNAFPVISLEFYAKCRVLGLKTAFPENVCISVESHLMRVLRTKGNKKTERTLSVTFSCILMIVFETCCDVCDQELVECGISSSPNPSKNGSSFKRPFAEWCGITKSYFYYY